MSDAYPALKFGVPTTSFERLAGWHLDIGIEEDGLAGCFYISCNRRVVKPVHYQAEDEADRRRALHEARTTFTQMTTNLQADILDQLMSHATDGDAAAVGLFFQPAEEE